jgi:predicted phosphodiesterase
MIMTRTLSWLHLSDLHIRAGDQYDQNVVLAGLLEDMAALREEGNFADFVFLTGDLVFSGKEEEFEAARRFITDLSGVADVPLARIYCVPGNHDVDRARLSPELQARARALQTRADVSALLGSGEERARYTERYAAYVQFVREMFPWAGGLTDADLSFTSNEILNEIRTSVVGLSSAWTAGADDDKGNLLIGERQVREALKKAASPELMIVLVHHPFSYLADFDASDVQALLNRRCDFILHGHLHETGAAQLVNPDNEVFHMAAGATYQGRNELLAYNFARLDLSKGEAQVVLRRWSDRGGGFWAADGLSYRSAPQGILPFRLPERLSRIPGVVTVAEVQERMTAFEQGPAPAKPGPDVDVPDPPMDLVRLIRDGKCVLFAGAGASIDAKLPSWMEMIQDLVDRLISFGSIQQAELLEVRELLAARELFVLADFCRSRMGKHDFASYLRERLSDTDRASTTHRLLSKIPFRAAVTTNFDGFLERSRAPARVEVILPDRIERDGSAGLEQAMSDRTLCPIVKLHGSYEDVDSIVLTASEFRSVIFRRPKYRDFMRRLFTESTLFFYGYSFRDPSINYLLMELMAVNEDRGRPHYALMPDVGPIAREYWWHNFNVRVISYPLWQRSHVAATAFLQNLCDATSPNVADARAKA